MPSKRSGRGGGRGHSSFIDMILDRVEDAAGELVDDLLYDLKRELPRLQVQAGIPHHDQSPQPPPHKRPGKAKSRPQDAPPNPKRPHPPQITLYWVLEVSPAASPETIQAAYQSLAKRFHPDKGIDGDGEKMRELNRAYEVLKDAGKRRAYDRSIGLL